MAVFRVEKNQNYTVMSNHHLRNADLSLKSKGLLSQMLSLPEEWDYTLKKTRTDTVAAMTAALPYMETEIKELAERTAEKLKQLTEEEFAGLVFLPAEDMIQ